MKKCYLLLPALALLLSGCTNEPSAERLMNQYLTDIRSPNNQHLRSVIRKFANREIATAHVPNTYANQTEIENLKQVHTKVNNLITELNKDWRNQAEIEYYGVLSTILEKLINKEFTYRQASKFSHANDDRMDRIYAIKQQVKAEQEARSNISFQQQLNSFQRRNQKIQEYYQNRRR